MANQIVVSAGAKVRDLEGVLVGTVGVVSSLPINASNGIPQLDVNGKILVSQLPNSVMEYKGTWSAATNTPTLADGTGNQGDVYLCNVAGTVNFGAGAIPFFVGDSVIYSGTIWQKASGATGTVTSVAASITGSAVGVTGSPITTSGTLAFAFAGTNLQYVNGAGNLTTFPLLTGYVPYTGATTNLDLGVYDLTADIITGSTIVKSGGTSAQFLKADGSVDSSVYALDSAVVHNTGNETIGGQKTFNSFTTFNSGVDIASGYSLGWGGNNYIEGSSTFNRLRFATQGIYRVEVGSTGTVTVYAATSGYSLDVLATARVVGVLTLGSTLSNGTYDYTLPSATGTLALTSDIPSLAGYVTLATTQTISGAKTFSGGVTFSSSVTTNNLTFANSGFFLTLQPPTLSVNRTVTLPNGTGTLALTSDLTGYLTSVTATSPLSSSGGVTPNITIALATTSANGYISSTDWNTFNNKQAALSGTGFVKIVGTTISYDNNTYYLASNPSSFIALTALSSSATGLTYTNTTGVFSLASGYSIPTTASQATWNTAYNDSIVSAAVTGTTTKTLTLTQQDAGTITASWTDINTDAVTSVFGRTGAVVATSGDYNTSLVTENVANLYYTEARVNANTNVAANTAARHNALTIGTANGLSLSTQVLSLALATTSVTGALSSTDWTTFNNKQSTITNPVTGTGTSGQVAFFNSTSSITSNAAFAFTPTSQLLVNNSVTAASLIARGTNLTSTLIAAANNDVLVGLDITPTFTNGAFTGVTNYGIRYNSSSAITPFYFQSTSNGTAYTTNTIGGNNAFTIASRDILTATLNLLNGSNGAQFITFNNVLTLDRVGTNTFFRILNQNVSIGTTTDAGYKLDVNGTSRFAGAITGTSATFTSGIFNNGTNSTSGIQIISSLSSSLFTSGIEFLRTTTVGGAKVEPFRNASIGGVGMKFLTTVNNAAEVSGTYNTALTIISSGKVGIGTIIPQVNLSVHGYQNNTITPANSVAKFVGADAGIFVGTLAGTPNYGSYLQSMRESDALVFPMFLNPLGGNVLIGTTTDAGYRLDVNGTARLGAITGTSATFSGNVTATKLAVNTTIAELFSLVNSDASGLQGIRLNNGINSSSAIVAFNSASSTGTDTGGMIRIHQTSSSLSQPTAVFRQDGSADILQLLGAAGATRLTIASSGAATFSSSVTAGTGGYLISGDNNIFLNSITGAQSQQIRYQNNGTTKFQLFLDTSTNSFNIYNSALSANNLTIASTGAATFSSSVTATSFFESSSIIGKNIIDTNPLLLLDIDVIKYTRKNDESKDIRYGYSAEQIHSLMPELTDKDVTAVKYLDVHTILIAQLQKEIKELKAKLN